MVRETGRPVEAHVYRPIILFREANRVLQLMRTHGTGPSQSPFLLSIHANRDLDEIRLYLDSIPDRPAFQIASSIQKALHDIAQYPYLGAIQSDLTTLAGVEVRSRLVNSYRIFYMVGDAAEIVGILHTARDIAVTMANRMQ